MHVRHSVPAVARATSLALLFAIPAFAQQPAPLLSPVTAPPAAAVTWSAAENARSPMVARSAFVRVDTQALAALPARHALPLATFALDLFERRETLRLTSQEWTLGYRVFHGNVQGHTSAFHLTLAPNGAVYGSIDVDDRTYVIEHTGSGDVHVLQQIEHARLPAHMVCGTGAAQAIAAPVVGTPDLGTNSDCGLTIVDLLVCYTPLARTNAGGVAAMETAIVGAVAQANEAFAESGIAMQFRLVHLHEVAFVEAGSAADLITLQDPTDGVMDEVHALRATYGADLVQLVTDPAAPQYCGIGYLMTSLTTAFAPNAFGVTVRTCIPNRSMTHECGHNMGCHHDVANAGPALYPYAYGYRTPDSVYRTVMAYPPGTRVNRLSSPNVQYLGYTLGTAGSADNVLTLQNTMSTVAAFTPTKAPVWCDLGGGIDGATARPTLTGSGTIDQTQPLQLAIRDYAANAPGVLIVGLSHVDIPAFGGTLIPSLDIALPVTGNGAAIVHDASWLANQPVGFEAWLQAAFLDAAAVQGLSASDAVRVRVP